MLRNKFRTIAMTLGVILILGITAQAQQQRPQRPPREDQRDAQRMQQPDAWGQRMLPQAGDNVELDAAHLNPNLQAISQGGFRTVDLQRVFAPPSQPEMMRLTRWLNITEQQREAIRPLHQKFFEEIRHVMPSRAEGVREVMKLIEGSTPDKSALQAANEKVEAADRMILHAGYEFWMGMKTHLTPEQQRQLTRFLKWRAVRQVAPPRMPPAAPQQ